MKKTFKIILIIILSLLFVIFLMRLINPREIDDINPHRVCEQEYIEKADILWVIPMYKGISIAENKTWCNNLLKLNKTLGMHGITHSYHEFDYPINESDLIHAKEEFKSCFGREPTMFKPPYLRLSSENRRLLKGGFNLLLE